MTPKEIKSALLKIRKIIHVQLVTIDGEVNYLITTSETTKKRMLGEYAALEIIKENQLC
jgi:hypothetical protein